MAYLSPWMSEQEIKKIVQYLSPGDVMIEWGSGGSTSFFPHFVKAYYSIEHDAQWHHEILSNHLPTNVKYFHVPLDHPLTQPTQKHQVQTYIDFIDTLGVSTFDKVLIDGRGRGWCAEKVIPYLNEDSIVFIHDYWLRKQYHIVENWFEVIDHVKQGQTLVVLRLKPKSDQSDHSEPE